jgi:hypothetical protein
LACDAGIIPILLASSGEVLDIGRQGLGQRESILRLCPQVIALPEPLA